MSKNSQRALTQFTGAVARYDFSSLSGTKTLLERREQTTQHVRSGEEFLFIVSEETVILDVNPKLLPKLEDFAGQFILSFEINCFFKIFKKISSFLITSFLNNKVDIFKN